MEDEKSIVTATHAHHQVSYPPLPPALSFSSPPSLPPSLSLLSLVPYYLLYSFSSPLNSPSITPFTIHFFTLFLTPFTHPFNRHQTPTIVQPTNLLPLRPLLPRPFGETTTTTTIITLRSRNKVRSMQMAIELNGGDGPETSILQWVAWPMSYQGW